MKQQTDLEGIIGKITVTANFFVLQKRVHSYWCVFSELETSWPYLEVAAN